MEKQKIGILKNYVQITKKKMRVEKKSQKLVHWKHMQLHINDDICYVLPEVPLTTEHYITTVRRFKRLPLICDGSN